MISLRQKMWQAGKLFVWTISQRLGYVEGRGGRVSLHSLWWRYLKLKMNTVVLWLVAHCLIKQADKKEPIWKVIQPRTWSGRGRYQTGQPSDPKKCLRCRRNPETKAGSMWHSRLSNTRQLCRHLAFFSSGRVFFLGRRLPLPLLLPGFR